MKLFTEISFATQPIMFAAWPGMGNVGLIAVDHIRRYLEAVHFAEIDMSQFFTPDSIVVKDGIAQLPEIPSAVFHYVKNPDMIIFESNAQVEGRDAIMLAKGIVDIAKQFSVNRLYTAAAFAMPMSHAQESKVIAASNNEALLHVLGESGVEPMPDGYIAGLNGLLLGIAAAQGLEAACFLGTIPSYASNISYPKASRSIVETLARHLALQIDVTELTQSVESTDKELATIEDRIRDYFPSVVEQQEHFDIPGMNHDEVPQYIMDRIEKLFEAVSGDRSRAGELKDELVRWNLFDLYERRFLDLFKDDESDDAHA